MGESKTTLYSVPTTSKNPLQQATRVKLPALFNQSRDVFTRSALSADGKLLATSQGSQEIQVWQLPTSTLLQTMLRGQKDAISISALAFSADGTQLTTVGQKLGAAQLTVTTWSRAKTP